MEWKITLQHSIFARVKFHVVESNHNVALSFSRQKDVYLDPSSPVPQSQLDIKEGLSLKVLLLHPYNVAKAKTIDFDLSTLNASRQVNYPNFMTSAELDKFCVNSSYFFACV
jgi:hypothetical protein